MYKAAFIDMDGTLLRSDHTVSDVTRQTIERLTSRGILIVPISARPLHGMLPITDNVFTKDTPIVSLNGSYIYHQDKIIYNVHVSIDDAKKIHDAIEPWPVSTMYYSQMEWYAFPETDAVKKEQRITPVPIIIQPFDETIAVWEEEQMGPNKILIAGDEKVILSVEKQLLEKHGGQLNIYKSQPKYLEVIHNDASKAKAIRLLMQQYDLKQKEIIAMGDNYNDQGMIEFAAVGVAMGNAPDAIKSVANYVTDTNNNDGVAKALQHFFD